VLTVLCFVVVLPADGDYVSVARTLDDWFHLCSPVVSNPAAYDNLGKLISPAEYSGVEVFAESKEKVEEVLNALKIQFKSVGLKTP